MTSVVSPVVGRDAVRATFAEIVEQFPDLTWETYRVLYGEIIGSSTGR